MPILHVVALKNKPEVTDEQMEAALREANIQERMPHLVHDWHWGKNINFPVRPADCKEFRWVMSMVFNNEVNRFSGAAGKESE